MQAIQSPCIKVCEMTPQGLCRGCLRTRDEIALWGTMSPEHRQLIMQNLPSRQSNSKNQSVVSYMKKNITFFLLFCSLFLLGCSTFVVGERSASQIASDASITGAVKSKLVADKYVKGFSINVDTYNSIVTLSGKLTSNFSKERAGELATKTRGVREVKNNLTVVN